MKKKKLWKLTTGRRHMSVEERAECLQLYMDGALLRQLTDRYDRHRVVISRLVKRAGVKRGHKFRRKRLYQRRFWAATEQEQGDNLNA